MKIKFDDLEGICLMAISGRIDSVSSEELESAINEALQDRSRIILDLDDTEYISSSGLRVLLTAQT
jgi:anti-sigma B factor antagonist